MMSMCTKPHNHYPTSTILKDHTTRYYCLFHLPGDHATQNPMSKTTIGVCTLYLSLPGMLSLKDKRRVLKSLLKRLHNTFNVSAAEVDQHEVWQSAVVGVAVATSSRKHADQVLSKVINWIEENYPDVEISGEDIEIL